MKRLSIIAIALAAFVGMNHASMAQSGSVVFYNAGGSKLGKALARGFNKHYPNIQVDLISAGSGELLSRIKAQQKNPRG